MDSFNTFATKFGLTEYHITCSVLAAIWLEYLWELYLSIRQHQIYTSNIKLPRELEGKFDNETLEKAKLYGKDKSTYSIIHDMFSTVVVTALIWYNGFVFFWSLANSSLETLGVSSTNEALCSALLMSIFTIFNLIIDLPFSVYHTFVLEEKHGFNKQTPLFYLKDKVKKLIVSQALSIPIIYILVIIIQKGGDYFFLYLWIFAMAVVLIFMTIYPDFIAPLFDTYSALPDGELRTDIYKLADSIEFPLTKLYVVDGSKRSAHSNAYFYGFRKNKRIVLFDTLLEDYTPLNQQTDSDKDSDDKGDGDKAGNEITEEKEKETTEEKENETTEEKENETTEEKENETTEEKKDETTEEKENETTEERETETADENKSKKTGCNNEEVLAVLAHELGHWKYNHVFKNLVIAEVNMLLVFAVFGLLYKSPIIYKAFGFYHEMPVFIGLIVVMQFIFAPYNSIISFLMTALSRRFEFQADSFAKELGRAVPLGSGLVKLNKDNLGYPVYDWLYSAWHHSHPQLLDRLNALKEKKKER